MSAPSLTADSLHTGVFSEPRSAVAGELPSWGHLLLHSLSRLLTGVSVCELGDRRQLRPHLLWEAAERLWTLTASWSFGQKQYSWMPQLSSASG